MNPPRYPILLVHGAGLRDLTWPAYWGRIPSVLEAQGAKVYYGLQDCWGSVETNAQALAQRIAEIVETTGCGKVNVIAHSKGGLDSRMAVSICGAAPYVASITTVATPHHGSQTVDRLLKAPGWIFRLAGFAVDHWIRIFGDENPDFQAVCRGFSTENMARFNKKCPDVPGVFYQSYGCVMASPWSDVSLLLPNWVVKRAEGENDGLVSLASARWGENFHALRSAGRRGISHYDAVDLRKKPLSKREDICSVYTEILRELAKKGL